MHPQRSILLGTLGLTLMIGLGLGLTDIACRQGLEPLPIDSTFHARGNGFVESGAIVLNVEVSAGSTLLAFVAYDNSDGQVDEILWEGVPNVGLIRLHREVFGVGLHAELWIKENFPQAGTKQMIIETETQLAVAACVVEVKGVEMASLDIEKYAQGTSTTPSSGTSLATAQAEEMLLGFIATAGPQNDAAGTWQNSFTNGGQRIGSAPLQIPAMTVSDAWRRVTSVGTYEARKTGITSRPWAAFLVGLKEKP